MSLTPVDSTGASRRRWWRIAQNASAAALGRAVAGLCQLALVPLLLARLGTETYGWAMALVAFVAMSQFADLGVAIVFQQSMSEAWARDDHAAVRRIYTSGGRLLRWLGAGWFVVALPLAWWLAPRLLPVPGGGETTRLAWLTIAATACIGVPLAAGTRLAAALQCSWVGAAWTAGVNVATLVAAWVLSHGQPIGPAGFVALLSASQIAPGPLTAWHLKRRLKWREPAEVDPAEIRRLWRAGVPLAGTTLVGALVQVCSPAAFARFGGYEASAAFSVLQRLFGAAQLGHSLLLGPLWPAYAEAAVRGERAWARHTLILSLVLTAAVGAGLALATVLLPRILPIWLTVRAPLIPLGFAWLIAASIIAAMFVQALSYLVLGFSRYPRIAPAMAVAQGLTLAAMAALGFRFGSMGVAAALAGGAAIGLLPIVTRESVVALREPAIAVKRA